MAALVGSPRLVLPWRRRYALVVRGGTVWASVYDAGLVVRVDAATGRILQRIRVGAKPRDLVFDGTSIWVVNQGSSTISRITP